MGRRYIIFAVAIVAFAVAVAFCANRFGMSSRRLETPKVIGAEPVASITVQNARQALGLWKVRYHGRIVFYFDETWPRFDPGTYYPTPLYRKYPFRVVNMVEEAEREHLSDENFLYFATMRGVVRDLRAILSPQAIADVARRAASGHNTAISGEEVFSSHHGLPRTFSTLAGLKRPDEPVLVFVSARFFRSYEPAALYRRLVDLRIATDSVVVCPETENPAVGELERERLAVFVRLLGAPL